MIITFVSSTNCMCSISSFGHNFADWTT